MRPASNIMADSGPPADRMSPARSRIGNGSSLFLASAGGEPLDGRTLMARVFRDTLESIVSDMGGREMISEGEFQLARRAAALSVECLRAETYQAAGRELDIENYCRATNALARTLSCIGLGRRQRDVTPDLRTYLDGFAEEEVRD